MSEKFVLCFLRCFFLRCLHQAEIGVQNQSLQKLDWQKTLANEKADRAEFDQYPV